jgi:3-methyl-2-oxobutanoate hydroxymethyltransferase
MLMPMSRGDKMNFSDLRGRKRRGEKFSVLTCYDVATARLMEQAGVEMLLVGDTAAEVICGLKTTREIRPEFLIQLTAAVRLGAPETFVLADLPFACRCDDPETTTRWAKRFMDETHCDAVKIEVTADDAETVTAVIDAGVPVIAHLGLLPQRIDPESGYRAKGRDAVEAIALIEEARRFEQLGVEGLLLEAVASEVSREIATHTELPVIGCVSGPHCDGTVVVLHDMIGWGGGHPPRLVKRYEDLSGVLSRAFKAYVDDIHSGQFPAEEHQIHMAPGELEKLLSLTRPA